MTAVDTLIRAGYIVPVVPRGQVLADHALAISGGRITAILPSAEAASIEARQVYDLPRHVLLPGFVNAHGHAAMSLLRGYADASPEFVRDGTDLAMAEMLRAGTTCFADQYFFPNVVAERVQHAGLRCQLGFPVFDMPSAWGNGAEDYISKGLALRDDLKHSELITVVFGPHAPYTVNEAALAKIAMLANELDLPVHIHLQETAREVEDSIARYGKRPLARLDDLGLVGPRTQCVHMTQGDDEDISLLAEVGAHVIHCPESNMKLASGRCPVPELLAAGINVALGTDSAASNNDLSMPGEMRAAALLAKHGAGDATALPAETALEMATINGARAMGLHDDIGSLETGKLADIIAVDFDQPETRPVYYPVSQLVYAADAGQVTHSWVGGRILLQDRELTTMDLDNVLRRADAWGETIRTTREQ